MFTMANSVHAVLVNNRWSSPLGLVLIAYAAIGCVATDRSVIPAASSAQTASPVGLASASTVVTATETTASPVLGTNAPSSTPVVIATPAAPPTPSPHPPTPSATVVPAPQTPGPSPTWTATPNAIIPAGVSGCVPELFFGRTRDCVARGLPPGAPVSLTANEVGGRTYVVGWLPPVDSNGNVPFPYARSSPGNVVFTVRAGSAVVTFEVTF
jgi:hypothetical protein